jgi:nicotinamidase-related amidase
MSDFRPVLLLMDFQHGLVERIADPAVVDAADRAAKAARAAGIPVMFVRVAFRPGYPEAAASNASFGSISQLGDAMTQDHPATQVHASLEPRADEPVIIKRRVSAFSGSDLDVLLRGANADSLILGGISTSGVVRRPTSTTASPSSPTPAPIPTPRSTASSPRRSSPARLW